MDSAGKSCVRDAGAPEPGPGGEEKQGERCTGEPWAGCTRSEPKGPQALRPEAGNLSLDKTNLVRLEAGERTEG